MRDRNAALEMLLVPAALRDSQPAFPSAFTLGADLNVSFNWKHLETQVLSFSFVEGFNVGII